MVCFTDGRQLSKDCFETVLQTMAEGLFIIDSTGIIRFCNAGLENMSGFFSAEITGRQCRDIMECNCGTMRECGLFENGRFDNLECRLRKKDGTTLPVLKNGRAIVNSSGEITGGVETLTDISTLKKVERTNEVLKERVTREGGKYYKLIGKSAVMQKVFELIDLAAASNATVLITGETGTGKELAARTIHEQSMRNSGPMVKVNCSALPESLLESELFGHVKGSFTGAIRDKIGRFELADGGTLFLDEIGDISPYIQVKLLRFLQEREFERVGESVTRKADVRIISATNRDLKALVKSGDFREDLYYRLKVFPVHLPALRERKDDIGMLMSHFVKKFNETTGKNISGFNSEAAVTMLDYCWPGNIRELENAIEHAFVTCKEKEIGIFDLPLEIRHVELRASQCTPKTVNNTAQDDHIDKKHITRELLEMILRENDNSRSEVASRLGIDRTTLWRYMKKFGIM
jgi:two-component system, NtrC family, response regulator HydG